MAKRAPWAANARAAAAPIPVDAPVINTALPLRSEAIFFAFPDHARATAARRPGAQYTCPQFRCAGHDGALILRTLPARYASVQASPAAGRLRLPHARLRGSLPAGAAGDLQAAARAACRLPGRAA